MYRLDLLDIASEAGIRIKEARLGDGSLVAIHLLNPDGLQIEGAISDALNSGFNMVVIHTSETWPG